MTLVTGGSIAFHSKARFYVLYHFFRSTNWNGLLPDVFRPAAAVPVLRLRLWHVHPGPARQRLQRARRCATAAAEGRRAFWPLQRKSSGGR